MNLSNYSERLRRVRSLMHANALDFLIIGPSADMVYLTGARIRPSERLAALVLPQEGPATFILPGFEAPSLPALPEDIRVQTWGESENPARLLGAIIGDSLRSEPGGATLTVGVSERWWSIYLLRLQAELPRAGFTAATNVMSAARVVKSPDEIEMLARAGAAADDAFAELVTTPFEGLSEMEVAKRFGRLLEARRLVVDGVPLVASGPNSASAHHNSGERIIERGDAVVLDFWGTLDDYYFDMTRTVFVGGVPEVGSEQERVYNIVLEAHEAAQENARPGMTAAELDSVARDVIASYGYGDYFSHRLGHGLGLDTHEAPYIVQGNDAVLRPGMVFSIEPGIYLPDRFGVRIEEIVALTESGVQRFNHADRSLRAVG